MLTDPLFDKPSNCCHRRCIVRSLFWAIRVSEHRIKFHHKEKVLSILNSDPTPGESGSFLSTVCYESVPNEEWVSTVLFWLCFILHFYSRGNHRLYIECSVKGAGRPAFELEVDREIWAMRPTVIESKQVYQALVN